MEKKKELAIRVETQKQFEALMCHYASKGYHRNHYHTGGKCSPEKALFNIIVHGNNWLTMDESNTFATRQYEIISFTNFAALTGIELPKDEVVIEISAHKLKAIVSQGGLVLTYGDYTSNNIGITASELDEIYTAYKSI